MYSMLVKKFLPVREYKAVLPYLQHVQFDKTEARGNHFKQLINKFLVAESTQKTVVCDMMAFLLVRVYQVLGSSNIRTFLLSFPNSCCVPGQRFFPSLQLSKKIFLKTYSTSGFLTAPPQLLFSLNTYTYSFRRLQFNHKYRRRILILNVNI